MAATTTALMVTAGLTQDEAALEVMLDLPEKSLFLGMGGPQNCRVVNIPKGDDLTMPIVSGRAPGARSRTTNTTADLSFTALSGTAATFTKSYEYDAFELSFQARNDISDQKLGLLVQASLDQSKMGAGNNIDASILGQYSSATYSVGSAASDFSIAALAEAKQRLKVAHAPGRYICVMPATQDAAISQIDELTRFDIRGDGSTVVNGVGYRWQGIDIYTSSNCTSQHGIVASVDNLMLVMRMMPEIHEWVAENQGAYRWALHMDYAYGLGFADWIVNFDCVA